MPNVKFILKEPVSKDKTLIYMLFRYNNQRFKYSTGQKIDPKFWNFEKQRVKETRQFEEYPEFNSLLNHYETSINNAYRKLLNDDRDVTLESLRIELINVLKAENNHKKGDLSSFIKEFIISSNNKDSTKKNYKQTLKHLNNYKDYSKRCLYFENIDLNFRDDFIKYMENKNYQPNYIGGQIKNIKVFMNESYERKLHNNLDFRSKKFKKIEVSTESIYLSIDEIKIIYDLDLSKNLRLDKVRDLFIIACYTGLRFSDLKEINSNNIIKDGTQLKIKTEKTGEVVIIPLHRAIKEILKKYNGEIPGIMSNQKMNQYLKELGKFAGINEKITVSKIIRGQTIKEIFEKYELITVHTARRSFATNAYLSDIPAISIMKITGHKTEKVFLKYIKISQEDNANKLENHPFFK